MQHDLKKTQGFEVHFATCIIPKHYDNQIEPISKSSSLVAHLNKRLSHEKSDCKLDNAYAIINLGDKTAFQEIIISFNETHHGFEAKKIISYLDANQKFKYGFFLEAHKNALLTYLDNQELVIYSSNNTQNKIIYPASVLNDLEKELAQQKLRLVQYQHYNEICELQNIESINRFTISVDTDGQQEVFFIDDKIISTGLKLSNDQWEIVDFSDSTLNKVKHALSRNILNLYQID